MKKLYVIPTLLLCLLFNFSYAQPPTIVSHPSTDCSGQIDVTVVGGYEHINGSSTTVPTYFESQIDLTPVRPIRIIIDISTLNDGDTILVYNGTSASSIIYQKTNQLTSIIDTIFSTSNHVFIRYKNMHSDDSDFTIKWTGAFSLGGTHTDITCHGDKDGTISLAPTGDTSLYTYDWVGVCNDTDTTNLTAGNYGVTVTDTSGCIVDTTITILEPTALTASAAQVTPVVCNGQANGSATVTPSGGNGTNTYLWDNGQTAATATTLNAGSHSARADIISTSRAG